MGVLSDPFAQTMLAPSMAAVWWVVQRLPYSVRARSVTLAGLAARVSWFDVQVVNALDAGITQVIVVGGGYDSRAWRFRRNGVQFFELDHPATQQDKARRAPAGGPTYVEADLALQCAADALLEHGFNTLRPALFVVEGVTMYLAQEVLRHQLGVLAKSSAGGSRLAADFMPPGDASKSRHRRQERLQRVARSGSGETLRLRLDRQHAVALIEESGWIANEVTSLRDAARALVPRESGLLIDAINEHKTLVAASHF
jgi:methyltransferase (TIGR00027 family)